MCKSSPGSCVLCLTWTRPTGRKSSPQLKYVVEIIHSFFRQRAQKREPGLNLLSAEDMCHTQALLYPLQVLLAHFDIYLRS